MNDEELVKVNALKKKLDGINKSINEIEKHIRYSKDTSYSYSNLQLNIVISNELNREEYNNMLKHLLIEYNRLRDTWKKEYDSYILCKQI